MTTTEQTHRQTASGTAPYRWLFGLIGLLIAAIFLVAAYIAVQQVTATPQTEAVQGGVAFVQDNDFDGVTAIDPPRLMPDFTLTNQQGEPMNLRDLQGKPTLITFGFTHCPDICPLTLNEYRRIAQDLGDRREDVNFVFISVDGNRDTPELLRNFFEIQRVDGLVTGLTGSPDEVNRLGVDYNLKVVYNETDASGGYTVDHTAGMFLLDRDNQWITRYAFSTDTRLIRQDVEELLNTE